MAQKTINLGTSLGDPSATPCRDALSDFQDNFTELYARFGSLLVKKLTGVLSSVQGNHTDFTHGLSITKIKSFTVIVDNAYVPNNEITDCKYYALLTSTVVRIVTVSSESSLIVSKNAIIYITYEN
jgi:hypothetical protein